ncbi:MAG: glutamate-1-semialdehyde 2,1-aminomutase [Armatimonadota bacterium]|nr:glutamate-1-semialdehyde 2,1-aminomutase [Armatimonadota bacterium]MDR5697720.1 glutamate-1-semialdehyde 2,1-aminomutase [Armatimonadota bacterium]
MHPGSGSRTWFERARRVMPGGVNSPVRAFGAVGGIPPFVVRGSGAWIEDADGRRYVDYVGSWGALILGHAHPEVTAAIRTAAADGSTFGAPTPYEVELAEALCEAVPAMEMVRLVSSGTEATMSALRVARAFTGRAGIVKFDGGYHGHADALLVSAGSGVATLGLAASPGVPAGAIEQTFSLPYNDPSAAQRLFSERGNEIAAIIVEPIAGNMGVVPPAPGFLEALRALTEQHGALLVFDEVITGFRLSYGCAHERLGVRPDLVCLGKIAGGGLPLAAYGGRADVMRLVAPSGPVYQAGTLAGNPVAVRAALATLRVLREDPPYRALEARSEALARGLRQAGADAGVPVQVNRAGSMLTVFFSAEPVTDYATARRADTDGFAAFFQGMLARGIYLPPSQFEAMFVSAAHTDVDVARTIDAAREAMEAARRRQ